MSDSIRFDPGSLDKLAKRLREVADRSSPEMSKAVWKLGAELVIVAKAEAKRHSQSIPATIRMVPKPGEADVIAGSRTVPLAVLYEFGNKKQAKRGVKFSKRAIVGPVTAAQAASGQRTRQGFAHPVYGNRNVWVTQESYPFLRPGLKIVRRRMSRVLKDAEHEMLWPLRDA